MHAWTRAREAANMLTSTLVRVSTAAAARLGATRASNPSHRASNPWRRDPTTRGASDDALLLRWDAL
jgi:hypothetical protein